MDGHHVPVLEYHVGQEPLVALYKRCRDQLRDKLHGAELDGARLDEKGFVRRSGCDVAGKLILDVHADNLVK